MEDLKQLLDFGEPYERFAAYHCFGDKAKEILSSLQQPYKDICNCNDDLHCQTINIRERYIRRKRMC